MEARVIRSSNRRSSLFLAGIVSFSILAGLTGASAAGEPTITTARTGDDGDGHIDAVRLTFSDAMSATSPSASWFAASEGEPGFRVEGYQISSAAWEPANQPTATTLRLNLVPLAAFDTGATPRVHYTPGSVGPKSAVTGLQVAATPTSGTASLDAAGPVLTKVTALDMPSVNVFNIPGDRVVFRFSEPVRLAGAAATRTANLENAIKLTGINEGFNGCPFDGSATSNQNFPQAGTGVAPIEPTSPTDAASTITVTMRSSNVASVQRFISVPKGCTVGIDPANNSVITDAAGNIASHQNLPTTGASARRIEPADIMLSNAKTLDGIVGTPDGFADAMDITFDQPLNDSTLAALASQLTITAAGSPVSGWTLGTGSSPNDANIRVLGAIPAGAVTVATTRAPCTQASSGTTTSGANGPVAFGAPYLACVGASTLDALDGVGPAIVSARTADLNADGSRDSVSVVFTEAVASGTASGWTLDGVAATRFTVGSDPRQATIDFPEAGSASTPTPTLAYTSQGTGGTVDSSGNQVPSMSVVAANGLRPSLTGATIEDLNGDGLTDLVRVQANRPVLVSSGSGFTYGGVVPTSATASGQQILLSMQGLESGAPAPLSFSGVGVTDTDGGTFDATTIAAAQIIDSVKPAVRTARTVDVDGNDRYEAVDVSFAEPITMSGPQGWTLEGATSTGVTVAPDGRSATIRFPEAAATAPATPSLRYTKPITGGTTDAASNQTPDRAYTATNGLRASITGASIEDLDGDGITDQVRVRTNRAVTVTSGSGFSYGGVAPSSASASDKDILLGFASLTSGAPEPLVFNGSGVAPSEGGTFEAVTLTAGQITDSVKPTVRRATTADLDGNGRYEAVDVTFAEPISMTGPAGWTLEGVAATTATAGSDGRSATIRFPEAAESATATPSLRYAKPLIGGTADAAGNQTPDKVYATVSGLGPSIESATIRDTNADGLTDQVIVRASRPVVLSGTPGFSYDGTPVNSVTANGQDITLVVAPEHGGAAKALAFDGTGVADADGAQMRAVTIAANAVVDAVAPIGTIEVLPQAPIPAGDATVVVRFTEPMTDAALTVLMDDRPVDPAVSTGHSLNGWRTDDARIWEGDISVSESDCAVSTGCPVTFQATGGKDARGLAQALPASLRTVIDTVAPPAATIAETAPLGNGDTAPTGYVNAATENIQVTVSLPAGEADGGTVEALIDGGAMNEPLFAEIADGATQVTLTSAYETAEDLRVALGGEGVHTLSTELCDASSNCTTGGEFQITVDTIPVEILVDEPVEDALVSGGDLQSISWMTEETTEDVSVQLSYSFDAENWMPIVDGLPANGTFDWMLPKIDGDIVIRGVSRDLAGNTRDSQAPATLTIDSSAPVLGGLDLSGFVPAGRPLELTWTASDASIDRVDEPITIEESVNGGRSWRPINAGAYSMANDGSETWTVPEGTGIGTRVRITAIDATGRSSRLGTRNLIRGVRGVVVDRNGRVAGYGSLTGTLSKRFGSDFGRDVALLDDGQSGYILGKDGSLHAFAFEGEAPAPIRGPKLKGIARQLMMLTDSSGYVVDAYGRLFRFGGAPRPSASTKWIGKDWTKDAQLLANGRGGYILDRFGRMHPFRIGGASMPPKIQRVPVTKNAAGFILRSNQRSGWILDSRGGLLRFGGAPNRANPGQGAGNAIGGFRVTNGAGYWIDAAGRFHPWGGMPGDPRNSWFRSGTVRNAN